MPQFSQIESISESAANDTLKEIYADIRKTLQVPAVNLVWRHLATIEHALEWAWAGVKPLYTEGWLNRPADHLLSIPGLPAVPVLSETELAALNVNAQQRKTVVAVLENYERSNPANLIALCALKARLRNEPASGSPEPPEHRSRPTLPELPPLMSPASFSDSVMADAVELSEIGTGAKVDEVVAGVPRHLAHWPALMHRMVTNLRSHEEAISKASRWVQSQAHRYGATYTERLPPPGSKSIARLDNALELFSSANVIANFIVKVRLLKTMIGEPAPFTTENHHASKPEAH